jgi:hypothetical protein
VDAVTAPRTDDRGTFRERREHWRQNAPAGWIVRAVAEQDHMDEFALARRLGVKSEDVRRARRVLADRRDGGEAA